ncbi:hypothetical protein ACFCV3_13570 [Kribbella sp. NPDC056345]|uniref:hypothetical protein n=1 Tax=Kribbella sp. NPDC056345 TaxID=3345789 RepID=UPI0035E35537
MEFGSDEKGRWGNNSPVHENTMAEGLGNPGPDDLKITAVSLVGAEGLEIVDSYVVLIKTKNSLGYGPEWPPPKEHLAWAGVAMKDLKPATGAILAPNAGVDIWNVVLHLRRPDLTKQAKYESVRVDYEVKGRRYFKKSAMRLELGCQSGCQ